MCFINSLAVPPNLRHKQLQEFNRTVTEPRSGRSPATTIPHDEAVGSTNAALLSLLPREAEERAHLDILHERVEVQLPRRKIQLHDERAGQGSDSCLYRNGIEVQPI